MKAAIIGAGRQGRTQRSDQESKRNGQERSAGLKELQSYANCGLLNHIGRVTSERNHLIDIPPGKEP